MKEFDLRRRRERGENRSFHPIIMSNIYDAAVIGAGVFGAWTAYTLQRAGQRVVLLDAYGAGNSRSSSGDESRVIRMSYGAAEHYTRWAWRALALWRDFCAQTGESLFQPTGVLMLACGANAHLTASMAALAQNGIPFELHDRAELETRFPQFAFDDGAWAVYEPESGALLARRAVQAVVQAACRHGATFLREAALPPGGAGRLEELGTTRGTRIRADAYVFACGPWLPKLFPALLGQCIHTTRQELFYFGVPAGDDRFAPPRFPTWIDFKTECYGLPDLEARGFKLAIDRHGEAFDPDTGERAFTPAMLNDVRRLLATRFPSLTDAPLVESRVCQYENTSNGDLLIDRHPSWANVWLVGGGSGHGFKHGPVVGEYVAERIVRGGETEACFSLASKNTVRERAVY
jgi:sarcosine oxidase